MFRLIYGCEWMKSVYLIKQTTTISKIFVFYPIAFWSKGREHACTCICRILFTHENNRLIINEYNITYIWNTILFFGFFFSKTWRLTEPLPVWQMSSVNPVGHVQLAVSSGFSKQLPPFWQYGSSMTHISAVDESFGNREQ